MNSVMMISYHKIYLYILLRKQLLKNQDAGNNIEKEVQNLRTCISQYKSLL